MVYFFKHWRPTALYPMEPYVSCSIKEFCGALGELVADGADFWVCSSSLKEAEVAHILTIGFSGYRDKSLQYPQFWSGRFGFWIRSRYLNA